MSPSLQSRASGDVVTGPRPRRRISSFHIVAATVTAKLNEILTVAQDISLEAVNAKALIVRTGDAVRAFRPITDYMDELAQDTIRLVSAVNLQALNILRGTIEEMRVEMACRSQSTAAEIAAGSPFTASFDVVRQQRMQRYERMHADRKDHYYKLVQLIEEIEARMKAARIIASTSRIEAAGAGIYQANVNAVADTLENAAKSIQGQVDECRRLLRRVTM